MKEQVQTPRFRIEIVQNNGDLSAALAIREIVFVEEQQVPAGLERDEEDAHAYHLLCFDGGHAIGTGRLAALPRIASEDWGKIGRMAVLSTYRGKGVGGMLMKALEAEAVRRGYAGLRLHSQSGKLGFYLHHGYVEEGPPFEEAGIPHVAVTKRLIRP